MLAGEAWRRRSLPRDAGRFHWIAAPGIGILLGLVAGLLPALRAYATEVADHL